MTLVWESLKDFEFRKAASRARVDFDRFRRASRPEKEGVEQIDLSNRGSAAEMFGSAPHIQGPALLRSLAAAGNAESPAPACMAANRVTFPHGVLAWLWKLRRSSTRGCASRRFWRRHRTSRRTVRGLEREFPQGIWDRFDLAPGIQPGAAAGWRNDATVALAENP